MKLYASLFSVTVLMLSATAHAKQPYESQRLSVDCSSSRQDSLRNEAYVSGTIEIGKLEGSRFRKTAPVKANLAVILKASGVVIHNGREEFQGTYRFGEGNNEDSEYDHARVKGGKLELDFEFYAGTVTIRREGAEFFSRCKIARD